MRTRNRALVRKGAEIVVLPNAEHKVDLLDLGEVPRRARHQRSAGGSRYQFEFGIAACRSGGRAADLTLLRICSETRRRGMFDLGELTEMNKRLQLNIQETRMIGPDLRILARPVVLNPGA